ncbi:MAG: glycosyltransferase family 2 protein [Anaerolineales bacterium]|nr:glycosyltransferase family 2 protein [Anaerolineales bacterium]
MEDEALIVPTTDPQAALLFCQRLAAALKAESGWVAPASQPAEPVLSVVIPVFNEEDNLPILYRRLTTVLASCEPNYEIVFVNDGSRDHSGELMQALAAQDAHLTVVDLARNFGHQAAISAGMDFARGQAVIISDADLQDPPEVLPQFIAKWREGYDVVYAIREKRKENLFKRAAYKLFYRLLKRIASIDIPLDAGDFCIMDRRVVDLLVRMPERNRFVRGIRTWVGYNQVGLAYERQARFAGEPKYNLRKLLYLALDGLVSFSYVPLRMITMLGFGMSFISIALAVFYAIKKLTVGLNPPGFATTIVSIFFLAGAQLVTLGVIGEYVGRIFEEVKRRPLYIVRKVIHSTGMDENATVDAE